MELQIIVDSNDEIIGYKPREEITPNDIYRISALWIADENGRLLFAQRASTKKRNPDKWTMAVVGTNGKGETYKSNIIKEAEEELGIKINSEELVELGKIFFDFPEVKAFEMEYFYRINSSTKIEVDSEEVGEIIWLSVEDAKNEFYAKDSRFVYGMTQAWEECESHIRELVS